MRSAGTTTSSKYTSQNSSTPCMVRSGRTSMPGVSMSTKNAVMPAWSGPGAGQQDAARRVLREAGPHLLAVDDPRRRRAARRGWSATPGRYRSRVRRSPGTRFPGRTAAAAPSPRRVRGGRSRSSSGSAPRASSTGPGSSRPRPTTSSPTMARRIIGPPSPPADSGQPQRIQPASYSAPSTRECWAWCASSEWSPGGGVRSFSSSQATNCDRNSAVVGNWRRRHGHPASGRPIACGRP